MQGRIKLKKFRSKRNMKRIVEANISVVVLTAMISLMAVATVLTLSLNEKAMTRQHKQQIQCRVLHRHSLLHDTGQNET